MAESDTVAAAWTGEQRLSAHADSTASASVATSASLSATTGESLSSSASSDTKADLDNDVSSETESRARVLTEFPSSSSPREGLSGDKPLITSLDNIMIGSTKKRAGSLRNVDGEGVSHLFADLAGPKMRSSSLKQGEIAHASTDVANSDLNADNARTRAPDIPHVSENGDHADRAHAHHLQHQEHPPAVSNDIAEDSQLHSDHQVDRSKSVDPSILSQSQLYDLKDSKPHPSIDAGTNSETKSKQSSPQKHVVRIDTHSVSTHDEIFLPSPNKPLPPLPPISPRPELRKAEAPIGAHEASSPTDTHQDAQAELPSASPGAALPTKKPGLNSKSSLTNMNPAELAEKLFSGQYKKKEVARILCHRGDFHEQVLQMYLSKFSFADMPLDAALRFLLGKFVLVGESQEIDRILKSFGHRYHECNPKLFGHEDIPYTLAFSLLMLNTDLHRFTIDTKMSRSAFVTNVQQALKESGYSIDDGMLKDFYKSVKQHPIIQPDEEDDDSDAMSVRSTASSRSVRTYMSGLFTRNSASGVHQNSASNSNVNAPVNLNGSMSSLSGKELHGSVGQRKGGGIMRSTSRASTQSNQVRKAPSWSTIDELVKEGSASSIDLSTIIVWEGLLHRKQVTERGDRKAANRSWKTFWCVLMGSTLQYFRNKDAASGEPAETTILRHGLADFVQSYKERENVFKLRDLHGVVFLFQVADSSLSPENAAKEVSIWVESMNFMGALQSGPPLPAPIGAPGGDYIPPTMPSAVSQLSKEAQLELVKKRLAQLEQDIFQHIETRGECFAEMGGADLQVSGSPDHHVYKPVGNAARSNPNLESQIRQMKNWERKMNFLNWEVRKHRTYVDVLQNFRSHNLKTLLNGLYAESSRGGSNGNATHVVTNNILASVAAVADIVSSSPTESSSLSSSSSLSASSHAANPAAL